jgi:glutathione S-transferase
MVDRLVTIPFSHYCEKARWALTRRGVSFVEEGHLPILHLRATRPAGGRSTPLLVRDDGPPLCDSTDIVRFADAAASRGERLFPTSDVHGAGDVADDVVDDVCRLEERFDEVLGPHSRRLAYSFLLDDSRALGRLTAAAPVPAFERRLASLAQPLVASLLRRRLHISAPSVERSRAQIESIFAEVEQRLADGRSFLVADRFTAADLTFASLAAPLVMPAHYADRWLIPFGSLPSPYRSEVERYRRTRAGAFALAMFERERAPH